MRGKGILLDDTFELQVQPVRGTDGKILSGLVIGNTLYQNQAIILTINPGEWKLSPLTGVGIENILLSNDYAELRRRIRIQMERDGQQVKDVIFSNDKQLVINATYG